MRDVDYEYSQPFTFGGITNAPGPSYSYKAPFPQDSECAVVAVTFGGTGYAFISGTPQPPTLAVTTALPGQYGLVFSGTANQTLVPDALFWTLGQEQTVYLTASGTGANAVLVTVIFRRQRRDRNIERPDTFNPDASEYEDEMHARADMQREAARERQGKARP